MNLQTEKTLWVRSSESSTMTTRCPFYPTADINFVIGVIKQLLQKADAICFTYQHMNCLYTLFKNQFGGESVVERGLKMICGVCNLSQSIKKVESTEYPALNKRTPDAKVKQLIFEFFPKDKINANKWLSFCRKNSFKKTGLQLEIVRKSYCFLDDRGKDSKKLFVFKQSLHRLTIFCAPETFTSQSILQNQLRWSSAGVQLA